MKNSANRPAKKIAFCGVIAALEVVLMMMTSLIPVGTFAFPCLAGAVSVMIVIEYGWKWALSVFAVVSVLSFFLAGDKEAVLYYTLVFGYYPVYKNVIERCVKSRAFQYVLKFALFNAAAIASFYAATFLLSVPSEEFTFFGVYVPFVFLVAGNVLFLLYDLALSVYINQYVVKFRNIIFKYFK